MGSTRIGLTCRFVKLGVLGVLADFFDKDFPIALSTTAGVTEVEGVCWVPWGRVR